MQPADERVERSRDLERLLTFVDGIAAVAITLLILPLVDLAGSVHSENDSVAKLISSHGDQFWAFGLSFVVIARLWLAQHRLMRNVVSANRVIVWCLIVWTFALVFLPFPTALLSGGGHQAITKCLYIGTLTVSSACLALLSIAIRRDPSASGPGEPPSVAAPAITAVLLGLALAISLVFPGTSYYPLLLLTVSDTATALWRRAVAHPDA